tara:strand:- start:4135 stop:4536 length:402 start_codon:yes stop_codon:yes gene_type:complete
MFSDKKIRDAFSHKKQKHSGFPSPASDYIENPIDLNQLLIKKPNATFLMRFKGEGMIFSGIKEDSILVIDRSLKPKNGDIVVASIGGEFFCRKIIIGRKKLLVTDCLNNKTKDLNNVLEFNFLGVVTSSINIY